MPGEAGGGLFVLACVVESSRVNLEELFCAHTDVMADSAIAD